MNTTIKTVGGAAALLLVLTAIAMKDRGQASSTSSPARSTNEITLTRTMKDDIGAAIRARGFLCPEPHLAWFQGTDAYGDVTQIWCGPVGTTDVYDNDGFRVTTRTDGFLKIEPWE
jgi:hypothetical protein